MRTFILRHDDPRSYEYAAITAESCSKYGMQWEYFEGFSNILGSDALKSLGIPIKKQTQAAMHSSKNKGQLCTASHAAIWKKMIDEKIYEAVILEHDAIMIREYNMMIPKHAIIALGYKLNDPARYVQPEEKTCAIRKISGIHGSHAYALTLEAATRLFEGGMQRGSFGCIDSHIMQNGKYRNGLEMMITDPIVALGWVRESTIQGRASKTNPDFIQSFKDNLI